MSGPAGSAAPCRRFEGKVALVTGGASGIGLATAERLLYRSVLDEAHPIGRIGLPSEAAAAVAFLASNDAGFVTGVLLPVDGGYVAQ